MIQLKIFHPLPNLFAMTDKRESITLEIGYKNGICVEDIFKLLAQKYAGFRSVLLNEDNPMLNQLLISVNGQLLWESKARKEPLADNSSVQFIVPYSGG